jgi:uncharacterized membrane protein
MGTDGRTDHALERLVFFSDAVFAIAITLLVIEIHVPHLPRNAPEAAFWQALAALIPNFVGYGISFAVIGAFWAGHHRTFMTATRYDGRIVGWNLALLGAIAFMPFVTGFMSAHTGLKVPTLVYCGWMLATALLNLHVVRIATEPPMVSPDASAEEIAGLRRRTPSVVLGAGTAFLLGFVVPELSTGALATIPLWRLALQRFSSGGAIAEKRPGGR